MLEFFSSHDREKILEKARKLKADGRVEQAIKTLESSVSSSPEDFDLYLELGRYCFEGGRRIDAVAALRKALALDSQRADEVVGTLTDLHYRGSSPIETGDALLEMYIVRRDFEEVERTLKSLSTKDLQFLETRYLKIFENTYKNKNPAEYTARETNILLQLASVEIFIGRMERGFELAEKFLGVKESERPAVQNWAKSVCRWKWGKALSQFYLMRLLLAAQKYEEALQVAQRAVEFDKTYSLRIHEEFAKVALPPKIQVEFLSFLSSLEVGAKDIDGAIANLNRLLNLDTGRTDDVIRGFRDLLRMAPKESKVIFALGDAYLHAKRSGLAVEEYAKVLEIDPEKTDEVLSRYQAVLKVDSKNPQVIAALVEGYLAKNDIAKATEVIDQSYQADPGLIEEYLPNLNTILDRDMNNMKALNLLGLVYLKKGEIDNAILIFENLLSRGSEGQVLAEAGSRAVLLAMSDSIPALKVLTDALLLQGRGPEALKLIGGRVKADPATALELVAKLDAILKADPALIESGRGIYEEFKIQDEFLVGLVVGRSFAYQKNYARAQESFQKCLALDPARHDLVKKVLMELVQDDSKAVPLMVYIARIFLKEGDIEKSARFFRAAQMVDPSIFAEIIDDFYDIVKAHPEDVMMRRLLVESLLNKGLFDRTIEECRITTEAVSPADGAYFHLKQAQAMLAKGRLTDAVRPFMLAQEHNVNFTNEVIGGLEKILSIDKNNIAAHFALGRAYGAARMVNKAVEELLLTARIVPTRVSYVMDELKRLETLAPANAMVHFAQGLLHVSQKNLKEGIGELDQAREMDKSLLDKIIPVYEKLETEGTSPELLLSQARAYSDKGSYNFAVDFFRKAFESDPGRLEQIVSGLKTICTVQPDNAEARRLLARIYFDYNALDDAVSVAREIYGSSATHRIWAIDFAREVLTKNPQHIPTYYFLAELCFDEGKFKEGIETLERLRGFAPHEVPAMIDRAEAVYQNNQYVPEIVIFLADRYTDVSLEQKSVAFLRKLYNTNAAFADAVLHRLRYILKKKPDIIDGYFLTADILSAQNDFQRAREALEFGERYATGIQDKVELRLRLANLLNLLGDRAGVSSTLMKALRIAQNKGSVYQTIRQLHEKSLTNRLEVLRRETNEDSRLEMVRIHLALGQLDEAEQFLVFVPSGNEVRRAQALLRARVYLARNRALDALEVLRPHKDDERIALALADAHESMGNYAAAVATLKALGRPEFLGRIKVDETKLIESLLSGKKRVLEGRR